MTNEKLLDSLFDTFEHKLNYVNDCDLCLMQNALFAGQYFEGR